MAGENPTLEHVQAVLKDREPLILRASKKYASSFRWGPEAADEIAQAVRKRLWVSLSHGREPWRSSSLAIYRAAHQVAIDLQRRHQTRVDLPSKEGFDSDQADERLVADPAPDDPLARQAMTRWLSRIPAVMRAVYDGLYVRELSQRELAAEMNVSQPRVAQLHRELLDLGRVGLTAAAA